MIRNLNSIRNQFKDIESASEEYAENGIAFMGCAMDTATDETTASYVGNTADFFYMMSTMCVSFYQKADMRKVFTQDEFVDYLCEGLKKSFEVTEDVAVN